MMGITPREVNLSSNFYRTEMEAEEPHYLHNLHKGALTD
jgi:hypothetical protein